MGGFVLRKSFKMFFEEHFSFSKSAFFQITEPCSYLAFPTVLITRNRKRQFVLIFSFDLIL
jgi:hypothetical protein